MNISQSNIFWDWNGTLLNDAIVCVEAMNLMLKKRRKTPIDLKYYRTVFGFPVVNYYRTLGFDLKEESFEDLSVEFIANYNSLLHLADLQPNSVVSLEYFRKKGKKQIIISAMEQGMLIDQLNRFGVSQYISVAKGISNIYAADKIHLAQDYLKENNVPAETVLFIGDTLHDKEVANAINAEIILVSNGHQSASRLSVNGSLVIDNLRSLYIS